MGMNKKLEREFKRGFEAGQEVANEHAELRGQIKGATETWDIMEDMFLYIKGIGPKTREKILLEVQKYARNERAKLELNMKDGGGQ